MSAYTSLEALLHDAFWAEEGEPAELPFLVDLLREHPGLSLEVGCGSGRLLLPLLQKGYQVEGLELSAEMLELCRRSAADLSLEPVLHEGDMTVFDSGQRYQSLLLPAFTLQLAADPAAALKHFHTLLEPGGVIYLSVFIPFAELHKELPEGEWYEDHRIPWTEGRSAVIDTRHRLNRKERILEREHRYRLLASDGSVETEHVSQQTLRWFTARQLHGLLMKAGFEPLHALADFDPEVPVNEEAQIITVVAQK
ncbi:class I SAM-dependent methyltransferase [Luteolibacter sp. GHJ8]|uniref:Class I SAM-dependent methyltransferase n=1 Tax=Luteolibacter rhizosphaerae TaxID=2989719 RepID=A0ABT3G682_9BACT|nr:class I SAM-dependent methyltransferase [Luteolibacter rhizosphaerae]MCW1915084.1 class I SAM-dependent methyltransferase [Luteolibacter rhizosphaerae]